jgi:iron-sulfur cluster repair protein YtfE (RIC family)
MGSSELSDFLKDRYHYKIIQGMEIVMQKLDNWVLELKEQGCTCQDLKQLVKQTFSDIESHLRKKEKVFYPYVSTIEDKKSMAEGEIALVKQPISTLIKEQKNIQQLLLKIKLDTANIDSYNCKSKVCIMCMSTLFEIEQDLNRLFHIEQSVLFPKLLQTKEMV